MSNWGSEGVVTAEEVRTWYQSRGIPVGSRALTRQHIAGWNKAHPDRPYVTGSFVHGTYNGYQNHGCRCEMCVSAGSSYSNSQYHAHRSAEARERREHP